MTNKFSEWEVTAVYLYDEEAVEGWRWDGPDGEEYYSIGVHSEPPPLPVELGASHD